MDLAGACDKSSMEKYLYYNTACRSQLINPTIEYELARCALNVLMWPLLTRFATKGFKLSPYLIFMSKEARSKILRIFKESVL